MASDSTPELTYFNGPGRANLTRLCFAAGNVDFVDTRVANWPEVKADGTGAGSPALEGDAALVEQKRWQLESAAAAIDRLLDAAGAQLGGAAAVGPGVEPLSSKGLVALAEMLFVLLRIHHPLNFG